MAEGVNYSLNSQTDKTDKDQNQKPVLPIGNNTIKKQNCECTKHQKAEITRALNNFDYLSMNCDFLMTWFQLLIS